MWIDSHCHLTHERIGELGSPEQLVKAAQEQGIDGMLTISCQIKGDFEEQRKTAQIYDNVWCSVGTHPHDSGLEAEKAVSEEELIQLANSDPKIVGIGESGLDYYYENSPREDQAESFRKHIRACIKTGLPLIVHTRDADEDTIQILKEEGAGTKTLKGVIHCFSTSQWLAEQAMELGFYISFSGIVTFKKAVEIQEVAKTMPLDRMLIETDAPYLAPVPYRGKLNQPAYVKHTGEFIADLRGISPEELARATKANFFTLFNKANPAESV